jgi:transcriptional regulator GlxA family with amidase domain
MRLCAAHRSIWSVFLKKPRGSEAGVVEPMTHELPRNSGHSDVRITELLHKLHEHSLPESLELSDFARRFNISSSRLRHLFKENVGVPPHTYLRIMRLNEAKRLLSTTFASVKEVSARVGYGDCSHFVRDYRLRFGERPSQTRRKSHADSQFS